MFILYHNIITLCWVCTLQGYTLELAGTGQNKYKFILFTFHNKAGLNYYLLWLYGTLFEIHLSCGSICVVCLYHTDNFALSHDLSNRFLYCSLHFVGIRTCSKHFGNGWLVISVCSIGWLVGVRYALINNTCKWCHTSVLHIFFFLVATYLYFSGNWFSRIMPNLMSLTCRYLVSLKYWPFIPTTNFSLKLLISTISQHTTSLAIKLRAIPRLSIGLSCSECGRNA